MDTKRMDPEISEALVEAVEASLLVKGAINMDKLLAVVHEVQDRAVLLDGYRKRYGIRTVEAACIALVRRIRELLVQVDMEACASCPFPHPQAYFTAIRKAEARSDPMMIEFNQEGDGAHQQVIFDNMVRTIRALTYAATWAGRLGVIEGGRLEFRELPIIIQTGGSPPRKHLEAA